MRTLRNIAAVTTAVCTGLTVFFHFVGIGAMVGAMICAYLWRHELWLWLHETWRRFWQEIHS